jgi:ATP-binding cassette subfamily C (CFTR/MRP) protein 1
MASTTMSRCATIDDTFGPWAGTECRGSFDFTLRFEELFLSALPLALVLVAAPFRIFYLWKKQNKVKRSKLLFWKLVCTAQVISM